MLPDDLLKRLDDRPVTPFRIHMSDGTVAAVNEPGMVIVGGSTAILPTRFGRSRYGRRIAEDWQKIALAHIVRFTEVDGRATRKRRPKR